jgi:DNA-binding XRE family transcriptional regulator
VASIDEIPDTGEEWECLRNACGLTRAELARRVSCDVRTIYALEHDGLVSDRIRLLVASACGRRVFPPVEVGAAA